MNQPLRLKETSSPAVEPVTLDDLKSHLRIDHDADDLLLAGLIATARRVCEDFTGCALISRNYSLFLDVWPAAGNGSWWDGMREGAYVQGTPMPLDLPRPPLLSVAHIYAHEGDGSTTELATENYFVDTGGVPGRIILKNGATVPHGTRAGSGIEIQFTAGYGTTPDSVPAPLRHGIRLLAAHLYAHRGEDAGSAAAASGAQAMFTPFRRMTLA